MHKQRLQSDKSITELSVLTVVWFGLTWAASRVLSRILVAIVMKGSTWGDQCDA